MYKDVVFQDEMPEDNISVDDISQDDISVDDTYECGYCKTEFSNEDTCIAHVHLCKRYIDTPITFSQISGKNPTGSVDYAVYVICRYIQQQAKLEKTTADFPISRFYSETIVAEIGLGVIMQMSMKNLTIRILSYGCYQYTCRAEWC